MTKNPTIENGELALVERKITELLHEGLSHGFARINITSEIVKAKKRRLTIEMGKSYVYIIGFDELAAKLGISDPCDWDTTE